ncbi:protein disulfide isomerase, putative [Ixodes scapularis]|uniref:Protein disulfide-isomerase n=1 Tax=Ixodes scapularis TaxID=6945 RepID=B7Q9F1_IXOSC|nr:protein disulfide isomerase, putative [Ixodes scapularis]|eukprot:XP_002405832.1 protein disulfide isomerase, putative [Ixodes scapularis]
MLSLKFVTLLCALVAVHCEDYEKDEHVLVLKQTNFDKAVTEHKHVLVKFYAPWCGHCKAMAPEYVKAAKQLVDESSDIKLAKVDATIETQLAETYEVRGYPTLKFFRDGKPYDYKGGRTADEMVRWLKKRTGPAAEDLKSADAARTFVDASKVSVVGFFKDQASSEALQFLEAAEAIDAHPFAITSDDAVYKELGASKDGVILFKKFDEGRSLMEGAVTSESVQSFVKTNSLPLVVEFTHESAQTVFGGQIKLHNLLFVSKKSPGFEDILKDYREAAKDFRHKVLFVTIDVDDEDHERILEFFGLKKDQVPVMRFVKLEGEMTKYKPEKDDLTPENVRSFVQDVLDGKLKQSLLSQDLPEDWDRHAVKVLVNKNFDEVVFDKEKDVLVEFYAPWCGHCKQLAPIYDELAEKYKEKRPDLVIAKFDGTANELEHTKMQGFPTIRLYKKGTNEAVEYNGERTLEGLSKFIDTDGEYGKAAPEEVTEEEEEEEDKEDKKRDEL